METNTMNDEKRFFVFILLIIGLFFVYTKFFMPKPSPEQLKPQQETETIVTDEEIKSKSAEKDKPLSKIAEETITIESDAMKIDLSNKGGVLRSVILKVSALIKDKPQEIIAWEDAVIQPLFLSRLGPEDFSGSEMFEVSSVRGDVVEFKKTIMDGLIFKKRIRVENQGYQLRFEMELENASGKDMSFSRGFDLICGSIEPVKAKEGIKNIIIDSLFTETSEPFKSKAIRKIKQREFVSGRIIWTAMKNKYFTIILDPDEEGMGVVYDFIEKQNVDHPQKRPQRHYYNALRMDPFILGKGENRIFSFSMYLGPKEYKMLASYQRNYQKLMGFSGPFGFLIKILQGLMMWFYGVFQSYGIAIILVSVTVKVIFYPLSQKSFKSMQKMQALQPLIVKMKEQYKDDPKKVQQETMALYRKYKVNPLSGCLPLLVQMPIFIALFRMLSNSVQLRGADFLWIKDLTMPDTIFKISGFNVNILPLVMGLSMFLQQRMTPAGDASQKKMVMFMPLIFTVIFYNMPSGLVLYWLVNTVLTLVQQYFIKKKGSSDIVIEDA